jgi:uncharacterized protein (TIRG00374 family)
MFLHAFGVFSLGQSAGMLVPTRVGNYAKVPLVTGMDPLTYEAGLSAVNAETILDLIYIVCAGVVSFFLLTVSLQDQTRWLLILALLLMALFLTVFLLFGRRPLAGGAGGKLDAAASRPGSPALVRIPASILKRGIGLVDSTRDFFRSPYMVARLFIYTLIAQFLSVVGLFLVVTSAHATVPITGVFAILVISVIVGILSMIPGGLGASDVSMIVLLEGLGISLPVATNIAVLWRCAMYIPVLAASGIYLVHQRGWGLLRGGA